ncbi:unnamed protein product [Gongylonema pulchrum]|uniref:COesterase domain-containing protein n=1 Tax=Gongylonema pulchrum TaxID=637853 RepID=A0A183DM02_9BILA|nr:unnamed protein product [Gongylonema pulchrum]
MIVPHRYHVDSMYSHWSETEQPVGLTVFNIRGEVIPRYRMPVARFIGDIFVYGPNEVLFPSISFLSTMKHHIIFSTSI